MLNYWIVQAFNSVVIVLFGVYLVRRARKERRLRNPFSPEGRQWWRCF